MANTGLTGFTQGGEGFLGMQISWRPTDATDKHAWLADALNWVLAESKGLTEDITHIEHDAYVSSRDTDRGHRRGKGVNGGPWTQALYHGNGAAVWEAALGFEASVDAIASDTTTAIHSGSMAPPLVPTTTPSASGGTLSAGTYKYAYTDVTKYGESLLGAETAGDVLSGATSSVALSAVVAGPVGTTARNIYRKKGTGDYGLVHTLADNTTATWTDTGAVAGAAPPTYDSSVPAGVSILGLTTGSSLYADPVPGREVLIDTGYNQEVRPVLDYDSSNKYLYVALLGERDGFVVTHSSSGTVVVAPAQKLDRPITRSDFATPQTNEMPRICVYDNVGGKYGEQYRSGLIGKLNIKAASDKVTLTVEPKFSKPRQVANGEAGNPDPIEFDESDDTLEDLSGEFQDGFISMDYDAASNNAQAFLQRFDNAKTWEIDIDNALKEESPMDGTTSKRFLPGAKRKLMLKMETLNEADYPVIHERFVKLDHDMQFHAHFAVNVGSAAAPSFQYRSFYAPHVRPVKSPEVQGLTDTVGENMEAVLRRAGGLEKLYCWASV